MSTIKQCKSIRHHIPEAIRRQVIYRDQGKCQYCGKQGIIGWLDRGYGYYWKYLAVWEIIEHPYSYLNKDILRNPDGSNTWIVPFHIDHITPVSQGGNNEPENLALACRHCNSKKQDYNAELLRL